MKGLAAILGVAVLMVVVTACGNGAEPTSLSDEVPTLAPPTEISLTQVIAMARTGELQSIEVSGDKLEVTTLDGKTFASRKPEGISIVELLDRQGVDHIASGLQITVKGSTARERGSTSAGQTAVTPTPTAATLTHTPAPAITVIQFGTPLSDFASGVAIDAAGNVYVVGTIQEEALPGQTGLGDLDAYLRKYDGQGNEVWTRQFGTQSEDHATGVGVDGAGNLYVVGLTRGALPGHTGLGDVGYDAYLRKYDSGGNELWTRQFGTPQSDHASDVAVGGRGNVYVVGFTFDDSLSGQADLGGGDVYLRKYHSDGNKLWSRQSGSRDLDMANGVAIDGAGNAYVVGEQGGIPGRPGVGESDAYLRKHDGDGNELWTRQFGSQSRPSTSGVEVDAEGNVYVVGSASGSLPGQTHLGKSDAYVRKYDGDGNELWTRQFGSRGSDMANGVAIDGASNVYVVGTTRLSLPGQSNMDPVTGGSDVFIRKYHSDGSEVWTNQLGTPERDAVAGVVVDGAGSLYVVGSTEGAFAGKTSSGSYDTFVLKMPDAPLLTMTPPGAAADLIPGVTPGTTLTPVQRLASRLSVMTLAVAMAREGHGFFDNFLPCVRRGVINYYSTDDSRRATFSSCDLGDGIIVHGRGALKLVGLERSTENGIERITISRSFWDGELMAVIDGETEVQINEFEIASVEMQLNHGEGSTSDRLQLDSLTVTLLGETMRVDDETLISQLFDTSAMDINSIPNPSKSLSALTESDMKRLAYGQAPFLFSLLLNEAIESQRGDHTHEYPCGTNVVTHNLEDQSTQLDNTWNNCDLTSSGLFMDGTFSLEGDFDEKKMAIIIEGDLTIGGGIPKITIRRYEWSIEGATSVLGQVRISGKIYGEVDERSFSFDLIVDD